MSTWRTVGRPGYVGRRAAAERAARDAEYGPGRWRIAYTWEGFVLSRDEALELYAEAYRAHLERNPDVLDWLVATARDVYDLEPRDVESGTDFSIQRGEATHLQDIAVRRAVDALGRRFQGRDLVRIRGRGSPGYRLSPGEVPFHRPELIEAPELTGWWRRGSIESFWQSNKILQVQPRRILIFGGSFNPIHHGHLALARHARDALAFDRVLFVPNGDNYRKRDLAPAEARLEMVRAAIEGERGFEVLDVEARSGEAMRVVKTTKEIRERFPADDLYLLRGLDALPRVHHKLFEIPDLRLLVVDRDGALPFTDTLALYPHLRDYGGRIDYRPGEFWFPLSSTDARNAVAAGRAIDDMVPARAVAVIARRGLYGASFDRGSTPRLPSRSK